MNNAAAYPLAWPPGWPRTPEHDRKRWSRFKVGADACRRHLLDQLRLLGAESVVVSTNVPYRQDGMPYADAARRIIRDPGVAIYFSLRGQQLVMARDEYARIEDNLRSIGLTIEAIRAVERNGGGYMMERAFQRLRCLAASEQDRDQTLVGSARGFSQRQPRRH